MSFGLTLVMQSHIHIITAYLISITYILSAPLTYPQFVTVSPHTDQSVRVHWRGIKGLVYANEESLSGYVVGCTGSYVFLMTDLVYVFVDKVHRRT